MSKRDFYDVLGVSRGSSADEMKKAFRTLAKELHPDRNRDNPEAEKKFKEVSEAYDTLKDPQKRAAYDQFGHAAFEGGGFGGQRGGGGGQGDFASAFADVFDDLFGQFGGQRGRGGQAGQMRGADLRYNLSISLEDAYVGKQATIRVPTAVLCDGCNGSGAEKGAEPETCGTCAGHGKVRAQQGFFTIERTCPSCAGRGQVIKNPCKTCNGAGRKREERTLNVQIPKGVEDGNRIRLAGEGEAGVMGGPPGDLYIFIDIEPHSIFKREGPDLFCRIPVPMDLAALGGHIEAPTIDGGRARVAIPAGAQSGKQFRLRGKGMPVLRQNREGDLYIEVGVETPTNLTKRQKELLEEFQKIGESNKNSPESDGFFSQVKEFWGRMTS